MTDSSTNSKAALDALHARLLELHKVLLDIVRAEYEREHGPVSGPGALLQLVTRDEAFAWLHPLSMLLVELDDDEAVARAGGPRALTEAVFRPGTVFNDRLITVAPSPAFTTAHDAAMRALKALV
ncbi:MAG: hypothetical protein JWP87_337 [Labilithrix sp.]|nr:hypothetical protein [Labilithrix sp.]